MQTTPSFSQRHPFLFGLALIVAAVALLAGAMAAIRFWFADNGKTELISRDKVGVVHLDGLIDNSRPVVKWIKELGEDSSVKGVLLRINSPGGVVAPSQEIYTAVRRLAERKPVVASMGTVAASGGYYAAAPATRIVANPGTITGSIGVIMELANMEELFSKIGIRQTSISSGKFKGAGSPFKPMTAEEKAYFEGLVQDLHAQFVTDVAAGRNMTVPVVAGLADGRALTGRQAQAAGLVDELGGYEDAMALLRTLAKVPADVSVVEGPKKEEAWLRDLLQSALDLPPAGLSEGPRWLYR
ncbi:MAG: signal peptide peptidase SppA [Thermodesulfobacteriota bacterium]